MRAFGLAVAGTCLAVIPLASPALDLTVGSGAAQNRPQSTYAIAFTAAAIAYAEPAPRLDGHAVWGRALLPGLQ